MPFLYVHVGHGKTGTSFIQSTLAKSQAPLEKHGIVYPLNERMKAEAERGISSGNGAVLLSEPSLLNSVRVNKGNSILVSGEALFNRLQSRDVVKLTESIVERYQLNGLRCLLFIRNPVEHAASFYQQLVKREGYSASVESFFKTYKTPQAVNRFIKSFSRFSNRTLTIKNYSNVRKHLAEEVAQWLDLPESALEFPSSMNVNRSLTRGELVMQRELNRRLGRSGHVLSDRLCNNLPDVKSEKSIPAVRDQEKMWLRLQPEIEEVNSKIESSHHYRKSLSAANSEPGQKHLFSEDQIREIVDGFCNEIDRWKRPGT
jgi:hypothetical protein